MLPSNIEVMVHTFQTPTPRLPELFFILPNISGDLCNVNLCVPITSLKLKKVEYQFGFD